VTPCLAHYGATVAEPLVPDDELALRPPGGRAAEGIAFLRHLGFELIVENLYPHVGRQWIFRRGTVGSPGYVERDLFTSFRAGEIAPAGIDPPRVGDTVFRLPVSDPDAVFDDLVHHGWAGAYLAGTGPVFMGPDAAVYELATVTGDPVLDRVVSLWTDPVHLDRSIGTWTTVFGFEVVGSGRDFHGVAVATELRRAGQGAMTLQLLTPLDGAGLADRVTDDIFLQEGYPHFRLGAPDKSVALTAGHTVFPDTGDVSYVLVEGAYLELVQL
jgi:hypothetical protein